MRYFWFVLLCFAVIFCPATAWDAEISALEAGAFDLESGTVLLNSGYDMPVFGFSCPELTPVQAENAVHFAIAAGFRLIDASGNFENEEAVGRAVRLAIEEGLVSREEIFITAGLWSEYYGDSAAAIQGSLDRLGLDHIDLMVLRQNEYNRDMEDYKELERLVKAGALRSIGLSGFYDSRNVNLITDTASIVPAVLQIEAYPYQQNGDLKDFAKKNGMAVMSLCPLGGTGESPLLFADPEISSIATWHRKTSSQIILRWQLQSGYVTVPSAAEERDISDLFGIFDFSLSGDEMQKIDALDRRQRLFDFPSESVD